jgi:hypothetical protein
MFYFTGKYLMAGVVVRRARKFKQAVISRLTGKDVI